MSVLKLEVISTRTGLLVLWEAGYQISCVFEEESVNQKGQVSEVLEVVVQILEGLASTVVSLGHSTALHVLECLPLHQLLLFPLAQKFAQREQLYKP